MCSSDLRRIPEDLSIVGVDKVPEGAHFWPPLTTVYQPLGDAGALAVKEIDELITKSRQFRRTADAAPAMTLLEPRLIVRQSSRKVAAADPAVTDAAAEVREPLRAEPLPVRQA